MDSSQAQPSMFQKNVLPNGLRVVSERIPHIESVALGVLVAAGSQEEPEEFQGITHFLEHMVFKGTEKRTARDIAEEIDGVGGELNALTGQEYTFFYARVVHEHLPLAMDLLSDLLLLPRFDAQAMEREKQVVIEEIKRLEDSPEDLVHDLFAQALWRGHPLGRRILGDEKAIASLSSEKMKGFMSDYLLPERMIVAGAGNLEHAQLLDLVGSYFGSLPRVTPHLGPGAPEFRPTQKLVPRPTEQVHFCLGGGALPQTHQDRYAEAVINATLGGGVSSRLFQEIRENRGLAYQIASYTAAYCHTGMFVVTGGTSPAQFDTVIDLIKQEFQAIRKAGVTDHELARSKEQMKGGLALSLENTGYRMRRIAASEMYWNRIISFQEVVDEIEKVSHEQVLRVAAQLFDASDFNLVAIGPFANESGMGGT